MKRRNSFHYRIMRSSNPVASQSSGKPILRDRIAGCFATGFEGGRGRFSTTRLSYSSLGSGSLA